MISVDVVCNLECILSGGESPGDICLVKSFFLPIVKPKLYERIFSQGTRYKYTQKLTLKIREASQIV